MRRRLLALMLSAAVVLLGSGSAWAAVSTSITISYDTSTELFHGKLSSMNAECITGRTVKLFKVTSNGPVLEGKDMSGKHGHWHVEVMNPSGKYRAVAPAAKVMGVSCARAK